MFGFLQQLQTKPIKTDPAAWQHPSVFNAELQRVLGCSNVNVTAADQKFLRDFFKWYAKHPIANSRPQSPAGFRHAEQLYLAALAAVKGCPVFAKKHRAVAAEISKVLGHLTDWRPALETAADKIIASGKMPAVLGRPDSAEGGPYSIGLTFQRPVSPQSVAAMGDLMGVVTAADFADYKSTRGAEIKSVAKDLDAGKIDSNDAPELALKALAAAHENKRFHAESAAKISTLIVKKEQAIKRLEDALNSIPDSAQPALGGWLSKVRKKINRGWKKKVVQNMKDARDAVSHAILPPAIQEFGRQIDRERSRFGRKVDKEMLRGVKNLNTWAPWIKQLAPLLALFPPLGGLAYLLILAAVSTIEITHQYRMKRELFKKFDDYERALFFEIQEINAETQKILKRVSALKAAQAAYRLESIKRQERRIATAAISFEQLREAATKTTIQTAAAAAAVGVGLALVRSQPRAGAALVILGGLAGRSGVRNLKGQAAGVVDDYRERLR